MKIALLALTSGGLSGGFRKYLDRLVPLLREQPEVTELNVFLPPQLATNGARTWPENDEMRGFVELRRSIRALRPDVVFIPTSRALKLRGIPVVTMVRNMEPLEVPYGGNTLKESLKNVARAAAARTACKRSTRVIAVSQHVRSFLVDRWRIPDARVGMVYHGIDTVASAGEPVPGLEGKRFLFTAGSIRPARGLEDLIVAAAKLDVGVVIAGSVDRGAEKYHAKMQRLAADAGVAPRITWAGQLDAPAMSWCLRNAAAFVMTSRAEACPNVVLEAMANGALSVSTDHAPMPEFFADGAMYYRERDASDLRAKLAQALAMTGDDQSRLRERAIARAGAFPWIETARGTVRELEEARRSASFT